MGLGGSQFWPWGQNSLWLYTRSRPVWQFSSGAPVPGCTGWACIDPDMRTAGREGPGGEGYSGHIHVWSTKRHKGPKGPFWPLLARIGSKRAQKQPFWAFLGSETGSGRIDCWRPLSQLRTGPRTGPKGSSKGLIVHSAL